MRTKTVPDFARDLLTAAALTAALYAVAVVADEGSASSETVIAGFRRRSVASVSDAVDKVTGKRGFMNHDLRPLSRARAKFVGPAVTALIEKSSRAGGSGALKTTLEAIDEGPAGSVMVVVVDADPNMTGIGGLMATACKARAFAGAVIDGAARDVEEIDKLDFPVFSRSICPSTVVGRMVGTKKNVPVRCGGVEVNPGDIIVAGVDGVVVVPRVHAAEVLKIATEIDEKESEMVPLIEELKSILKAVEKYKRM